jgi:hypothetical protein
MMAQEFPTFVYDGDKMVAFHGNTVVASGTDHQKVAETAEQYFNTLTKQDGEKKEAAKRESATHITTPNGDSGTILGRTAGLWSDEITVRFDNGQIRRYATYVGDGIEYSVREAADAPKSPVEALQRRVDEAPEPGRAGLTARLTELDAIRTDAHRLASTVSYEDQQAIDRIVMTANAEKQEVREALAYLENADAEAMAPPTRAYAAVEQAELGRGASDNWLDVVANQIVAETEGEDFDKLLAEGPSVFAANLETGSLAHSGTVQEMAREFVTAKTAGYQGEAVDEYRNKFVAAAEMARRSELAGRKNELHKEAAAVESSVSDAPDEALFL